MNEWTTIPTDEVINKTAENLNAHNMKTFIVDNKVAYTEAELVEAINFYNNLVEQKALPSLKVRAAAGFIPLDQLES